MRVAECPEAHRRPRRAARQGGGIHTAATDRRAARGNDRRGSLVRLNNRRRDSCHVLRPAEIGASGGREQIARVAVWNCCEDRTARREVLVRLARHDRCPLTVREVVHRQEQEIGSSHQCERVVMRDEAENSRRRRPGGNVQISRRQHACKVDFEACTQLWVLSSDPLDRFDQEDVRAGQDVNSANRAAE